VNYPRISKAILLWAQSLIKVLSLGIGFIELIAIGNMLVGAVVVNECKGVEADGEQDQNCGAADYELLEAKFYKQHASKLIKFLFKLGDGYVAAFLLPFCT
jgi:hypothetical protein